MARARKVNHEIAEPASRSPRRTSKEGNLATCQRYLQALTDFGRTAAQGQDFDRLVEHVVSFVSRTLNVDRAKTLRYQPDKGNFLVIAGVGWREGVIGHATLPVDVNSPPGRALQTGQPSVIDDLPNDREYRYSPLLREHGIVSLINVPIFCEGGVWGVLEVDSEKPRIFGKETTNFLSLTASILGNALQRRRVEGALTEARSAAVEMESRREFEIQEVHHRVKNNFQLVLSLLTMQRRRTDDAEALRGLQHLINRVTAIGLAHDQLTPRPGASTVQLDAYLGALCASIQEYVDDKISIETDLDSSEASIDRAVPIGLIVNELVSNSTKYAFGGDGGLIKVVYRATHDAKDAKVVVSDNGRGMGPPRPGGTGLRLVDGLVSQISGRVERTSSSKGTKFTIRFPPLI